MFDQDDDDQDEDHKRALEQGQLPDARHDPKPEDRPDIQQRDPRKGVERDSRGRLMKGTAKVPGAGKKPGSPRRKFNWNVRDICEEYNYNPVEGLIHTAATSNNATLRFKANAELLRYCAPTLRSTETKTETTTQVVFKWAEPDETIPTINADGTPTVTYTPDPIVFEAEDSVIDRLAAVQHDDNDTPSG